MLEENSDRGSSAYETQRMKRIMKQFLLDGIDLTDRSQHSQVNQYILIGSIGKGQHGTVSKAVDISVDGNGSLVAVKKLLRKNKKTDRFQKLRAPHPRHSSQHPPVVNKILTHEQQIMQEIRIMKQCNHPNVVSLYEVINDPLSRKIYIVMEYLGGGEIKWMTGKESPRPTLAVEQTRRIMRDAILGLEYLHSRGIVHRDIKPANLLWTEDRSQVKIADFGVSHATVVEEFKHSQADSRHVFDELARMAGTPAFLAPELVYVPPDGETEVPSQRPPITKAIDIWALGVTMYCLLFAKTPFDAPDASISPLAREHQLYAAIREKDFAVAQTMGCDRVPTGGRHPEEGTRGYTIIHLLDHLMEKDPTERIEMAEIKNYPWFTQDVTSSWIMPQLSLEPPVEVVEPVEQAPEPAVTSTWTRLLRLPLVRSRKSSSDRSHPRQHRKRGVQDIGTRSFPSSRSSRRGSFPNHHGDPEDTPLEPRSRKDSRRSKHSADSDGKRVSSTNHDRPKSREELLGADCTACPPARNRSRQTLAPNNDAMSSRSSNINLEDRPPSSLRQRVAGWMGLHRRSSRQSSIGASPIPSSSKVNGRASGQQLSRSYAAAQPSVHDHFQPFSERRATSWGDIHDEVVSVDSTCTELDFQSQFVGAGGVGVVEVVRANSSTSFYSSSDSSVGGGETPQPVLPPHILVVDDRATTIPSVADPAGTNGAPPRQHGISPLAGSPLNNGVPLTNGSVHSNSSPYGSEGSRGSRSDESLRDEKYEGDQFEEDDGSDSDEGIEIQTGRRHATSSIGSSPPSSPPLVKVTS